MLRLYPGLPYDSDGYSTSAEVCKNLIWDVASRSSASGSRRRARLEPVEPVAPRDLARQGSQGRLPLVLHFIDVPVDTAVGRCAQRAAGSNPGSHVLTPGDVRNLALIFEKPTTDEGMPIEIVRTP